MVHAKHGKSTIEAVRRDQLRRLSQGDYTVIPKDLSIKVDAYAPSATGREIVWHRS